MVLVESAPGRSSQPAPAGDVPRHAAGHARYVPRRWVRGERSRGAAYRTTLWFVSYHGFLPTFGDILLWNIWCVSAILLYIHKSSASNKPA